MNDPSNVAAMVTLAEATVAARDLANDRLRAIRTCLTAYLEDVEPAYRPFIRKVLELAIPVDGGENGRRPAEGKP